MKNETKIVNTEKHILLDAAINGIDEVDQFAYDLLQRIQGDGSKCGVSEDTIVNTSNLQDVLDNGHHKINTKMTEIRNTLIEIEATLF